LILSVKKPWGEEEHKKAIKAFRHVYPNWSIVSNQPRCPKCHRPNFCSNHHYAYEKWLGSVAGVLLLAIKDRKLKEEFEKLLKEGC